MRLVHPHEARGADDVAVRRRPPRTAARGRSPARANAAANQRVGVLQHRRRWRRTGPTDRLPTPPRPARRVSSRDQRAERDVTAGQRRRLASRLTPAVPRAAAPRGPSAPRAARCASRPAPPSPRSRTSRRNSAKHDVGGAPRRDCRSARRPAPAPGGWRARGRPRRAAARRPTAGSGGASGGGRARARSSSSVARASASAARRAADQLRQDDILGRVEIGQQMVELIDEAELVAAHRGAPVARRAAPPPSPAIRIEPPNPPSSRPTACSSVDLPEPDGPSSATISPGATVRSTPRSTSIVTPPCAKLRVRPVRLEDRLTHSAAPAPDRCSPPCSAG